MKRIFKNIILCGFMSLLIASCSKDSVSDALQGLRDTIHEAEQLIATTEEGLEKGDIAPGSKGILQTRIDQAYFIMENTSKDEAYSNATEILKSAISAFLENVVKEGIPHFDLGSKMNVGPSSEWNLREAFSIEMKVRFSEFVSGDQNVVSTEGGNGGFMIRNNGNQLQFYINNGGWCGGTVMFMELNKWYHIAATYKANGAMVFYVDGEEVKRFNNCGTLSESPVDMQFGTAPSYSNRYMRGDIQYVSIWEDERTASEVKSDLKCDFTGTEEGLMAYWPLDLNIGTEILDKTGNRTAHLVDVVWTDPE